MVITLGARVLLADLHCDCCVILQGDTLNKTWSFGDGSHSTLGDTATHTYTEPGLYSASFSAVDSEGATVQCIQHVQVGWIGEAKIISPLENSSFRAGESILLVAEQHVNVTRWVRFQSQRH